MSATISDHFNKASDMSGAYPTVATVSATRSSGATTLSCDDLGGWATDTPVHFSTFQVNTDGTIDTTTQTDWKGIVSGNNITDLVRLAGAADSGNAAGDRVELNPTIGWLDDLVKGLLVSHLQDGTLKDGIVSTAKLADDAVTSAKIADDAVTNDHIADGAIDSYAKIADATILPRNISLGETTDSAGWRKIPLSDKVILYIKRGQFNASWGGRTWRQNNVSDKPTDLVTSHHYVGVASGLAGDHAINVCGFVDFASGKVEIQTQNIYDGSVSSTIWWCAHIVEILN